MIKRKRQILFICEGNEEYYYLSKILSFPVFNKDYYEILPCVNAKGNSKLFARYQDKWQSSKYDAIFVFCDYDKGSDELIEIKRKFAEELFGGNYEIVDELFILVNPVTLQIVLSHFGEVRLTHVAKSINKLEVAKLTGICNYDAKEEQIKEMMQLVKYSNYETMKINVSKISSDLKNLPSTNILTFLEKLESDDFVWLDEIIEKCNHF